MYFTINYTLAVLIIGVILITNNDLVFCPKLSYTHTSVCLVMLLT